MPGQLDIRRHSDPHSAAIFEVRYEDLAGNSFAASMNGDELHDLLYRKLAIDSTDEALDREYAHLLSDGRLTFQDIELRDSDLAGAGLRYLPAEG